MREDNIGFKRGAYCPLCCHWHPIEYQYKGIDVLCCPKAEEDKIALMTIEYVRDELNRLNNMQRIVE